MESLKLSFEAVTPIFLMMFLGYLLRKSKFVEKKILDEMNKLVFKIFLPMLLFYNIYGAKSVDIFDEKLVVFTLLAVFVMFALGLLTVFLVTDDNRKRGVMLQGFFRSNFAILGVPIVGYICKDGSVGIESLMVALVIPIYNVLAVISLEIFNGGNINFKKVLKGIATNPLIIGCILGLVFLGLRIKLPFVIEKTISDVSKVASPLAIVILGGSFTFSSIRGYVKENLLVGLARLVVIPFVVLTIAEILGFSGEAFACLLVIFGGPIAVSSFSMAQQMGGDETLAGQLVVLTSIGCVLTLFVWIFAFSSRGVI